MPSIQIHVTVGETHIVHLGTKRVRIKVLRASYGTVDLSIELEPTTERKPKCQLTKTQRGASPSIATAGTNDETESASQPKTGTSTSTSAEVPTATTAEDASKSSHPAA